MINDSIISRNGQIIEIDYELGVFDSTIGGYPAKVFISVNGHDPVHFPRHIVLRNLPGGCQAWKDCGTGVMYSHLSDLIDNELVNIAYYL